MVYITHRYAEDTFVCVNDIIMVRIVTQTVLLFCEVAILVGYSSYKNYTLNKGGWQHDGRLFSFDVFLFLQHTQTF